MHIAYVLLNRVDVADASLMNLIVDYNLNDFIYKVWNFVRQYML